MKSDTKIESNIIKRAWNLFNSPKYKKLFRFATVGGMNTGIDIAITQVFISVFSLDLAISKGIGYSCGIINSFIWNKLWTFENRESNKTKSQFAQFLVINLITYGASALMLKVFVNHYGMHSFIANIIAAFIAQFVNFFGYKLWVFKVKT